MSTLSKCLLVPALALVGAVSGLTIAAGEPSGGSSAELVQAVQQDLKGKTVAWVPVVRGIPITDEWTNVMQQVADANGMKLVVRDPNFNATASLQAVTALIDEKPDVLVVHNPNVQILAKELKRAQEAGIYVVQVNMVSNYKTDAYVGANWFQIGKLIGEQIVKECGSGSGTSGKVQIVQGELTSSASLDQFNAAMDVLKKDPAIKVVSTQAANWDATTANKITTTVIQQHPDLCANYSFSGLEGDGSAQAIKAAGKLDHVKIFVSSEGAPADCADLLQGNWFKMLMYNAKDQGADIMRTISFLLQSKEKPGTFKLAVYTDPVWVTKENAGGGTCFTLSAAK